MLPSRLSDNLCSLRAKVPRLAMTVSMEIEKDFAIGKVAAFESVIEVRENLSYEDALDYLLSILPEGENWSFQTQIMIKPGYRIKSIAGLITNFHQPNSTLLCLVSACLESGSCNQNWRELYDIALSKDYRFLSYGDGCLLELT